MKIRTLLTIAAIVAVIILGMPGFGNVTGSKNDTGISPIQNQTLVTADEDSVLERYEDSNRTFEKLEFQNGDVVYYHQRMIGNVIVEGDFINYQVVNSTGPLRKNFTHWRDDLPDESPNIITTEEEAVNTAGGGYATLYYISPDSAIFSPVEPAPEEPCWIVWKRDGNNTLYNITVVGTQNGTILGYGIPPPSPSFVYTGPSNRTTCEGTHSDWYESAQHWFEEMGYSPDSIVYPTKGDIRDYIQNDETALIYGIAHGSFWVIDCGCHCAYNSLEVREWIADYAPLRFTFLASCDSLYLTTPGSFAYEFTKGSDNNAVVVGYSDMGQAPEDAWRDTLAWQNIFFSYMSNGWTVGNAYIQAGEDIPKPFPYIKFAGDASLQLVEPGQYGVPTVSRCTADLDIGVPAIDRVSSDGPGWTLIQKENPANASGTINFVVIYAKTNLTDCDVATFYETGTDTLTCRSVAHIGDVPAGSEQIFSHLSLTVEAGDYIGIYSGGTIEAGPGDVGIWWDSGYNKCIEGLEKEYTFQRFHSISLYGTSCGVLPPVVGYLTGEVRGVNSELLYGIEVCAFEKDRGCYDCVIANPDYNITVYDLGTYYLVANSEQGCGVIQVYTFKG
jgi:hypothetical protein